MGFRSRMRKDASMTDRRDFKKRVRERQAATGENYTTARAQVLAQRPRAAVPVVEMIDASAQARLLGLSCAVLVAQPVIEQIELIRLLSRLRDALIACEGDPRAERMRAIALHGAPPPREPVVLGEARFAETQRFYARARAGLGGFSARGQLLALHLDGVAVVCSFWPRSNRRVAQPSTDMELVLMIEVLSDKAELSAIT